MTFLFLVGCVKTSTENRIERHKEQFLHLAEFECEGIYADHFVHAEIDNLEYCVNANDTISSHIWRGINFTTTGPSNDSTTIIEGSSFVTAIFGVHRNWALNTRVKYLYFRSDPYPDTTSLLQMAEEIFVEGVVHPISGTNVDERALSCRYEYSDGRQGYNNFHYVSSEFGSQSTGFLSIDKVTVSKDEIYVRYDVEMTFEADLYIDPDRLGSTNLWGEVRNGKMVAQFKILRS